MKKYYIILMIVSMLLPLASCELDNYEEPDATLSGTILDENGTPLQLEQGGGSMKLRMDELSWSKGDTSVAVIPFYLNVKQDGSYVNTKVFAGQYAITPWQGPFYPYTEGGDTIDVKGKTVKDFVVTPYLNLEWVTEPFINSNGFIQAEFKFTRNAKDGEVMPDLNDCQLYIATTQYVGKNNYDNQMVGGNTILTNGQEGTTISLITIRAVKYVGLTYYVRIGASCKDAYKKYNYTDIKEVVVASDFVIPVLP